MSTERFIKIIFFGIFLIIIFSYANVKRHSGPREQILGPFMLGGTIEEVRETLGELGRGDDWTYYKDYWSFRVDENDKALRGIAYADMDIKDEYSYPETSKGVTIGSRRDEVAQAYGDPEQVFSEKTWCVSKNSVLSLICVYPSKGVWIRFINQNPYSGTDDWRVTAILVGDKNAIEEESLSAQGYLLKIVTQVEREKIITAYEKKFGPASELEIYDDYILNHQTIYFEYVKSRGEYIITPIMILPKEKNEELLSGLFDENSNLSKNIKAQAKNQTALRYSIALEQLEQIIERVEDFRADSIYKEIVELE